MNSGSSLQIGHQILRDLSYRFGQIEKQFDLLEWVDSQLSATDLKIDGYVATLARSMQELAGARRSAIFTYQNDKLIDFSTTYNEAIGHLALSEIPANVLSSSGDVLKDYEDVTKRTCGISVRIFPNETPPIIIVLEDAYFGRRIAPFYDEGFLATARMIAARSAVLIDNHAIRAQNEQTRKITNEFLSTNAPKDDEQRGIEEEIGQYIDKRWQAIVEMFAGYFPAWQPFAFAERPLVQVLTVDQLQSKYVVLRATHGSWSVAYKPLERDKTICGLLLEKEEREGPQDFLLVNPREYEDRYTSLLYKNIPQSEFVIPIRDQRNKVVALINLEHPAPDAFSEYHRKLALSAAGLVRDFILHLIWNEEEEISNDKLFRYVIVRLIKRLSDTYLHKINNQIPVIKGALKVLEKQKDKLFQGAIMQDFVDVRDGVYALSELSKYFLSNLAGYISFGKVHLADMVDHSTDDIDTEQIEKTENIQIRVEKITSDIVVFGSELIREHIYNIIKNALDQLRIRNREARKNDQPINRGEIEISVVKNPIKDLRGRQATYELVRVSIRDNAGGIPKEHEDKVLQQGYSTKREIGGTGFGLSAAAQYMVGIGGYLDLENEIGAGLTVHLDFPLYTEGYHEALARKMNVTVGI